MRNNTEELICNFIPYLKMLENINKSLTKVIKTNFKNKPYKNEELFYNITSELLRLMPYKYEKEDNKLELDKKCGIMLLSDKPNFIEEKYNKILNYEPFCKVLKDALKIRNKYIHEPHNISFAFSVNATTTCSMSLYYKTTLLSISTISIAPIVYYLNKIYNRVIDDIKIQVRNNNGNKKPQYYNELIKYDFRKWNYTILPEYLMFNF